MYLKKITIPISTTGGATNEDYSTYDVNGTVYGIYHDAGTLPSTATITVRPADTTGYIILNARTATADDWFVIPQKNAIDSTGAALVLGEFFPIIQEKIKVTVGGATSSEVTANMIIYFAGDYGG